MKITQEEFNELYSENITVKRQNEIIAKIDNRFAEIMHTICPDLKKRGWFDYDNCCYDAENSGGYFDKNDYKEFVYFGGEKFNPPAPYNENYSFPTRWLWEDFEPEFHAEVAKYKNKQEQIKKQAKASREKRKAQKIEMMKIIQSKLTKEELKFIKFK